MKKVLILISLVTSLVFFGCQNNTREYKKIEKFEELVLLSKEEYSFEFDNQDATKEYDVIVVFRYAQGFQFPQLVLEFGVQTPGNDKVILPIGIPVKTPKGEYLGDGSGDIWDIEQTVLAKKALPKGKTTFTLQSGMPYPRIPLVMELGLKIVESK